MPNSAANLPPTPVKSDLVFPCTHCQTSLVVDSTAAGMTVICQRCAQPTIVPVTAAGGSEPIQPRDSSEELAELRRHLKENESQRTEVTGYINQLSIQLHRWQLRLQTLNERNKELTGEIGRLDGPERPLA